MLHGQVQSYGRWQSLHSVQLQCRIRRYTRLTEERRVRTAINMEKAESAAAYVPRMHGQK
eukprot:SAG31_NODE_721_length_12587_cov_5.502002_6_plen_60_part_00